MNPFVVSLLERIKKEKITIKSQEINSFTYSYNYYRNEINYPKDADIDSEYFAFSLAHELGHYYQYYNRSEWRKHIYLLATYCSQSYRGFYTIFFPIIFLDEIFAWFRGWDICREEKVSTLANKVKFIIFGLMCTSTYLMKFFSELGRVCVKIFVCLFLIFLVSACVLSIFIEKDTFMVLTVKEVMVGLIGTFKPVILIILLHQLNIFFILISRYFELAGIKVKGIKIWSKIPLVGLCFLAILNCYIAMSVW